MSVHRDGAPILTSPSQYAGQARVAVAASAVVGLTPRQNARLVDEWCDFFLAGPTGIQDFSFPGRMPKRLFAALASQTQLRRLAVLTGVYDDLSPLAAGMQRHKADIVARRTYEWRRGERIGHWISDDGGASTLVRYDLPSYE